MGITFATLPASEATLKEVRKLYNLRQVQVAEILKCTQANVSKLDSKPILLSHLIPIAASAGHKVKILIA